MTRLTSLALRLVYDSRGAETVEATVGTDAAGALGRASAPSGASTGQHEVMAFPTGGVAEVLRDAPRIERGLVGLPLDRPDEVDGALHALDGTPTFTRIGGNTATAISVAAALAGAAARGERLSRTLARPGVAGDRFPAIVGNCLNGGRHGIGGPEFQEFHAIATEPRPDDAVRAALAVHRAIGEALRARFPDRALGRGDEGGWVAALGSLDALEILSNACATARDRTGLEVRPGLDLAASEFYRDGRYRYRDRALDAEGQLDLLTGLVDRYGLAYLEDPFHEEDFDSFARLTAAVGTKTLVVGDDLFTTRAERLQRGIDRKSTNAILIKVNQVGTVTDTLAAVDLARARGLATITSHRSGETTDDWLAHLAVAFGSAGLKCGLLGGERVAKLNELRRLGAATARG